MLCIYLHFNIKLIDGLRWGNQVGIYSKSQINPIVLVTMKGEIS